MKMDKERFFEVIDCNNRLSPETKVVYWKFYQEECGKDIINLYKEGASLFKDPAIHQTIKDCIDTTLNLNIKEESDIIDPISTPTQKETATTWGTNDDVKGK